MSDGIYVRVTYRDEICFEHKFRAISGDTIVLSVDELVEEKVAAEREACANVLDEMADDMLREMEPSTAVAYVRSKAAEIRSRGK